MTSRRRLLLVLVLLSAVVGFPLAAQAGTPFGVAVGLFGSCVFGVGPAKTPITATLRTPKPKIRARDRFRVKTDSDGYFVGCFDVPIHGGNSLKFVFAGKEKILQVPRMWPTIDRVEDTVTGRAQPGTDVTIVIDHRKSFKARVQATYVVTADSSGHYALDTTADINLRGFDIVTAIIFEGNNQFVANAYVPGMIVGRANSDVTLVANLGDVSVHLANRHGSWKATATAGHITNGIYFATFFDGAGAPAYPLARDVVTSDLATDAHLRMPVGNLTGNARRDMVTGRCPPNARYELDIINLNEASFEAFFGKADGSGNIVRDVGNRMNLKRGDELTLRCLYPTGDEWWDRDVAL